MFDELGCHQAPITSSVIARACCAPTAGAFGRRIRSCGGFGCERLDVGQVLQDRGLVALLLVSLVPLVVVVEDEGDDIGEIVDEPVRRSFR